AVADGMGGAPEGRFAAELAVLGFFASYFAAPAPMDAQHALLAAVRDANARIFAKARENPAFRGMGATLTAAALVEDQGQITAHIVHVGDSSAFLWSAGRIRALTREHNLRDQGLPHILTRSVGTHAEVEADYATCAIGPGDRLLLCTDGVSGSLGRREIGALLGHGAPADAARAIVEAALAAGTSDNATALVIEAA
ncbi:MAG: protein phosphatase 2C domain-containing protein, partial [Alphaproteobacteria bacterium]